MTYTIHIEKSQRKFLRLAAYKKQIPIAELNYDNIATSLKLESLDGRRVKTDRIFLLKLINNLVDSHDLLSSIIFTHLPR